jgi:hypothetical protein
MMMAMASAAFGQGTINFSTRPSTSTSFSLPPVYFTTPGPNAGNVPVVPTVQPAPSPETFTVRVWDSMTGPVMSWDVKLDPAMLNIQVGPPMPWLIWNSNPMNFSAFSALFSQAGPAAENGFVGPLPDTTAVPEPAALALIGLGAAVMAGVLRRKKGL